MYRRTITLSLPADVVERFDALISPNESRSAAVSRLMQEETQKQEEQKENGIEK